MKPEKPEQSTGRLVCKKAANGPALSFDLRRLAVCGLSVLAALFLTTQELWAQAGNEPQAGEQKIPRLVGHGGPVRAVYVTPDGKFALSAGSLDYTMIYWALNGNTGTIVHKFDAHDAPVSAVVMLPGGRQAMSASDDGALSVWDLKTGKLVKRLKQHTGKIATVAITRDGRLAASASWDATVRIWDLKTFKLSRILKGHNGPVNDASFSADGRLIYTASYDGTIRQWDVATGAPGGIIYKHGLGVNVLAIVPGGKQLVFGALDGRAGVVDIKTGEIAKVLRPHDGPVLGLTISVKNNMAALSSGKRKNGFIHVYRLQGWEPLEIHQNPFTPIWSVAFSADARHIFYGGLDDFINIWQVSPRQAFEIVASKFPRRFEKSGDMDPGELQFARKCSICHTLKPGSANRGGPSLYRIFGRRAGTVPGFSYSRTLLKSDIIWNEATIDKLFALGPEHYTPGTKMPLQRITNNKQRKALITFLKRATGPKSETTKTLGK